jgi:hypothetical protein
VIGSEVDNRRDGSSGGDLADEKLGTYRYTVHLGGVKAHAHTGTVVVK